MPFDASEFPRASEPRPPTEVPVGRGGASVARSHGPPPGDAGEPDAAGAMAVRLLRAARASIEAEEDWGRGAYQLLGGQRCAVGALHGAAARAGRRGSDVEAQAHGFLLAVARGRGFAGVEPMNDASAHAEVLAAFDAAIERAQRR